MTNINLYQDDQEIKKRLAANTKFFSGGVFFSLMLVVLTLLVFVGLKIYVSQVEKNNAIVLKEIENQRNSIIKLDELGEVIDVQKRLQNIKDNLKIVNGEITSVQVANVLDNFEKDINNTVVVSSFNYDDSGKIEISFESNSYSEISRQIMNFKNSKNLRNVILTKIAKNEKTGNINCDLEMHIK
ncbi:MAG TPA: hypothetical protein PLB52_02360 [Candidatus Moranbacteria bacterium]|nr:hypothetical protein [Candidatus Moranbacteria bacterium]